MTLEDLLKKAEDQAMSYDGDREEAGMGGIVLRSNPYESCWLAEANWSDNSYVRSGNHENPRDALIELMGLLADGAYFTAKLKGKR